jgi:hypothetical protein
METCSLRKRIVRANLDVMGLQTKIPVTLIIGLLSTAHNNNYFSLYGTLQADIYVVPSKQTLYKNNHNYKSIGVTMRKQINSKYNIFLK